jgi:hypothetical protein
MGFMRNRYERDYPDKLINAALDEGINFIDTARSYCDSEKIIGQAIKGRREDCFLVTKTFLRSANAVKKEIELSLKNLKVEKIDIYQIHHIQYEHELQRVLAKEGALSALREAKKQGKIDYIGFSSHHPEVAVKCIQTDVFDTAQIPFNLIEREYIDGILKVANEYDVGIIVMKPLAGGKLTNAKLALKFILSYNISVVIPGCSTVEQVRVNAEVGRDFTPLTEQEKEEIFKELGNLEENFCRRCRYCEQTCPISLPIPDIFRCEEHLIYNATYARNEYKKFQSEVKKCIDCGECEKVCPYKLPVRDMLKKANNRLTKGKIEDSIVNLLRQLNLYDWARKTYFDLNLPLPKR